LPRRSGTWHWPAFLLGVIWMMYRRMYRLAAMWAGLLVLISVVETLLDVPEGLSHGHHLRLSITTAIFAATLVPGALPAPDRPGACRHRRR
jgi:hypothetical protein